MPYRTFALRNLQRRSVDHGFLSQRPDELALSSRYPKAKRFVRCRHDRADVLVATENRDEVKGCCRLRIGLSHKTVQAQRYIRNGVPALTHKRQLAHPLVRIQHRASPFSNV